MSIAPRSIIVVGAGVFGAAAALALRRRGHQVALFDPGPLPHPLASSTDISKVIRMDYGADEFYMELMEIALDRWSAWTRNWEGPLYHEVGFLIMRRDEMPSGSFEYESFIRLRKRGHKPQRMNSALLRERFPAWAAENYTDGYFNPRAGWAASGKVVEWLVRQAEAAGVALHEGRTLAHLLEDGSRVGGIVTAGGERHHADLVVMATGAWTPVLLPHLHEVMWPVGQPVFYVRPHNLDEYRPPRFSCWAADISRTGWYGFPVQDDGTFKLANHGPGRWVHPNEPRTVAPEDEERCREFLRHTFPSLANAPFIGDRLCLYCDTWDSNFWIDHDPEREGLVVAAGGSGHGFKFAPVIGEIIADVVEHKSNPYAGRFSWRARGETVTEPARYTGQS